MLSYRPAVYHRLPVKSFAPKGWMQQVLEIQAKGLPGRLDQMGEHFPIVGDSRWLGGEHEMSSETEDAFPLWFKGFLPLGYLLRDPELQARANGYIDRLLSMQEADGWAGPVNTLNLSDNDRNAFEVFSVFQITNALSQIDDPERNDKVEEYIYRAYRKLYDYLDSHCLQRWSQMMWSEGLYSLYWLYERRPEVWILELAHRIRCRAFDFKAYYAHWPWEHPTEQGHWNLLSHIVNNTLSMAVGPLCWQITGDEDDLRLGDLMFDSMTRAQGTVIGHFNGDECFSGPGPLQGAELCSIVSSIFVYFINFSITGDAKWMDRAEALAFNSYPATVSPDMETHQYDQQVNQVNLQLYTSEKGERVRHPAFTDNGGDAALFGLAPQYPCCTCSMGQGYPKLAIHQVLRSETGLIAASYVPTRVETLVKDTPVTLEITGDYPFRETVELTVTAGQPVTFALELRIPGWAQGATLNGEPVDAGMIHQVIRTWEGTQKLRLHFPMSYIWIKRANGLSTLKRGPLVYALKIEEEWKRVEKEVPGCPWYPDNYELEPRSPWNFGVANPSVTFTEHPIAAQPWSPDTPPITASVWCQEIDWPLENGMAALQPAFCKGRGESRRMTFIPYGCTNLRLTELPMLL